MLRAAYWCPVLVAALVTGGACDLATPSRSCLASVEPGLVLEIREAGTDLPAAFGALAIATSGVFQDTLQAAGAPDAADAYVAGLYERAGTYDLHVERTGYGAWDTTAVEVRQGLCHVQTVRLLVRLQPQ